MQIYDLKVVAICFAKRHNFLPLGNIKIPVLQMGAASFAVTFRTFVKYL